MKTPVRLKAISLAGTLATIALLAGCFETKQEFTLNPDGSGKVIHESTFQNVTFAAKSETPEQQMRKAVADVINHAKGVDAWRDVTFKLLEDGRIQFKGTAYFKSLAALEFPNQTMLEFDWEHSADGTGVLTLRDKKKGIESDGTKAGRKSMDLSKLSPGDRTKKIKEERAKFQQMKPMMAGVFGAMRHEVVFHLPGQPGENSSFIKDASGSLALQFDGAKLLSAMEALMNDDDWLAKNAGSLGDQDTPALDERMSSLMFGGKGPVRATVKDLAGAAFEYDAEVSAAREEFATVQQHLNVGPATAVIAAPAQGGELKSLKVMGVRLVREADESREIQPFGNGAGYTLSLLAELPGSVQAMTDECSLTTASADDGSDLLPESDFNRKIHFPKLTAEKAAVLFEVELKAPGAAVKGIREVSGHLQYKVAGPTKELELALPKLVAGAKAKELSAEIESIKAGGDGDKAQTMELKLAIEPDALRAIYLEAGKTKTELKQRGYGGGNGTYTFTYESETGFPAKSRLVAEIYDRQQTFDVPFKLENITLLGEQVEAK
jgi:hypothetical protein